MATGGVLIYGVGSGRSGTRSLAASLGLLHEPDPSLGAPAFAYLDKTSQENFKALKRCISKRMENAGPGIADHHQSLCIPTIIKVDPDAQFIWMVRNPILVVTSWLSSTERFDLARWRKIYPHYRTSKPQWVMCCRIWEVYNSKVWESVTLLAEQHRLSVAKPESLPAHIQNRALKDAKRVDIERELAADIMDRCGNLWLRMQWALEQWPATFTTETQETA